MDFNAQKPIYSQIIDVIYEYILTGTWISGERIPSVRDMAISMAVNPNTLMRSYAYLEEKDIIHLTRGVGYFLTPDAKTQILALKKAEFLTKELPDVFRSMELLSITIEEFCQLYARRKSYEIK